MKEGLRDMKSGALDLKEDLRTEPKLDPQVLLGQWQSPIYNLARRRLGNDADAADVTQEIFIQAFSKLDQLSKPESFRAWLYRIAHNAISKAGQRRARRRQLEVSKPLANVQEAADLEAAELQSMVRRSVEALQPDLREVLELTYYHGLSQREVAQALSCPRTTVQARLKKALSQLRQQLSSVALSVGLPSLEIIMRSESFAPVPETALTALRSLAAQHSKAGLLSVSAGGSTMKSMLATIGVVAFLGGVSTGAIIARPLLKAKDPKLKDSSATTNKQQASRITSGSGNSVRGMALISQANSERRKRKQAEAQAAALEAQLTKLKAAQGVQSKPTLAFFLKPQAAVLANPRQASNEAAAIGALRTLSAAQALFKERHSPRAYGRLEQLAQDQLIDEQLGAGEKQGYQFGITLFGDQPLKFAAYADPIEDAGRHFFVNHEGVIYSADQRIRPESQDSAKPNRGQALATRGRGQAVKIGKLLPLTEDFEHYKDDIKAALTTRQGPALASLLQLLSQIKSSALDSSSMFKALVEPLIKAFEAQADTGLKLHLLTLIPLEKAAAVGLEKTLSDWARGSDEALAQQAIRSLASTNHELWQRRVVDLAHDSGLSQGLRNLAIQSMNPDRDPRFQDLVDALSVSNDLSHKVAITWAMSRARPGLRLPEGIVEQMLNANDETLMQSLSSVLQIHGQRAHAEQLKAAIRSGQLSAKAMLYAVNTEYYLNQKP